MPVYTKAFTAQQRNRIDVWKATHTTNTRFPEIMAVVTKLGGRDTELGNLIVEAEGESSERDEARKGKVDEKEQLFSELVSVGSKAAAAGRSLARDLKDQSMFALCNYSKTELAILRGAEIVPVFQNIYNVVNTNSERMPEFGFTPAKKELFNTKFTAFKIKYGDVKADLSAGIASTKTIVDIFKKGKEILEDMDDLVDAIQDEYPDYYNQYQAARVIHDLGGKHETEETPAQPETQNPQ